MRAFGLVLLIIATVVLSAANESPQPNPKSSSTTESPSPQGARQANDTKTTKDGAGTSISSVNQPQAPKLEGSKKESDQGAQKEATYTGFLVIVGLFAIFIGYLQYRATDKAADAAKASAEAASRSAEIAEKAIHIDRPYLVVEQLEMKDFGTHSRRHGRPVHALFVFQNYGRGVAIDPRVKVRFETVEGTGDPLVDDLPAPPSVKDGVPSPVPVPPPEQERPTTLKHDRFHLVEMWGLQAIPPNAASAKYRVVLGGTNILGQLENPDLAFMSEAAYEALNERDFYEVRKRHIAIHIVVDYSDTTKMRYHGETIGYFYMTPSDPDSDGTFIIRQSIDVAPQR
jgi:hypothetical protein